MDTTPQPIEGALALRVFRRALGFVHLWAFGSLWIQLGGLIGPQGIRPARLFLERVGASLAAADQGPWLTAPSLFWLTGASSLALNLAALAGMLAAAALLLFEAAAAPALALLYLLYLSFFTVSSEFLHYQWDLLLLETTFAALVCSPRLPHAVWLPRLLAFKLVFSSGVVKLTSGDPTWRDLSALDYHYWTQPIPHLGGLMAWHLPGHALSCALMFVGELLVPLLIFVRPAWAFWPLTALMAMMGLTGNYGFFHVLSVTLFLTLLPDATWAAALRRVRARLRLPEPAPPAAAAPARPAPRALYLPAIGLAVLAALHVAVLAAPRARRPGTALETEPGLASRLYSTLSEPLDAWQLESGYGLFAHMTTDRLEIQLEGTADGTNWRPYRFRYKPFDAHDLPPPALFHMPRLEWQMWFAGLGTCRRNPWFLELQRRLLQGSAPVRGLFEDDPFPDAPPVRLRSRTERFTFSDAPREGIWKVSPVGDYCPEVSLEMFAPE